MNYYTHELIWIDENGVKRSKYGYSYKSLMGDAKYSLKLDKYEIVELENWDDYLNNQE